MNGIHASAENDDGDEIPDYDNLGDDDEDDDEIRYSDRFGTCSHYRIRVQWNVFQ